VERAELEELDKRKVDWGMLKSTVLTLTRQNIHGSVVVPCADLIIKKMVHCQN